MDKVPLFKSLQIKNFVIHEDTEITFSSNHPLTIVAGANGSGKTLIMQALQLILGYIPPRIRKGGVASNVGEWQDYASIRIVLNNPFLEALQSRIITTSDPQLQPLINTDEITIEYRVYKNGRTLFFINNRAKFSDGTTIKRDHIREIIRSCHLYDSFPLIFVDEHTFSAFSTQSTRQRFRTFLELTSLQEQLEKLKQAKEKVHNAIKETEPLRHKLSFEEQVLELREKKYEQLKEKKKLQSQLTYLEQQLKWAEVIEIENKIKEIKEKLTNFEATSKSLSEKVTKLKDSIHTLENEEKTMENTLLEKTTQRETVNRKIGEINARLKALERLIKEKDEEIKNLRQRQAYIQSDKAVKDDLEKISSIEEELTQIRQEKELLFQQLDHPDGFDTITEKTPDSPPKSSLATDDILLSLTKTEKERFSTAMEFLRLLTEQKLDDQIRGPLFLLTKVKEEEKEWEQAVRNLLGNEIYTFIAIGREEYQRAYNLLQEAKNRLPKAYYIKIARFNANERERQYPEPPEGIYAWATELIEGDPFALWYLRKIVYSMVAPNTIDPNYATDIAQKYRANILTQNSAFHFHKQGSMSAGIQPTNLPLGKEVSFYKNLYTILETENKQNIRNKRQKRQSSSQTPSIGQQLKALETKEKELTKKLENLKERSKAASKLETFKDIQKRISKLEHDKATKSQELQTLQIQEKELKKQLKELKKEIKKVEEHKEKILVQLSEQRKDVQNLETQIEEIKKQKPILWDRLFDLEKELEEKLRPLVKDNIPRPEFIRPKDEIAKKIDHLKAKISMIKASDEDEQRYWEQKTKVEQFRQHLKERDAHIANLQLDLERRLENFSYTIKNTVAQIRDLMHQILQNSFQVQIEIHQLTELDDAQLFLYTKREGDKEKIELFKRSNGERFILSLSFLLAIHLITLSPFQVIDEFGQGLDDHFIILAKRMLELYPKIREEYIKTNFAEEEQLTLQFIQPQFLILLPHLKWKITDDTQHYILTRAMTD